MNNSKSISQLKNWKKILSDSIVNAEQLAFALAVKKSEVQPVIDRYPMRINSYYLSLIRKPYDPIWKQAVPDIAEIHDNNESDDPLFEENQSPVPNLIHRYPDRVVFLVSNQCAVFCRHCMRKRKVGDSSIINSRTIKAGLEYIQKTKKIRDVILSGGDPFLLDNDALYDILQKVRSISHVQIIRIHTRIPCALPQRVDYNLAGMLKKFHPLYINTHFNHPSEITPQAAAACGILADAGIPLGCQTVLLKGVNDDPLIMKSLMQKLIMIRVKPYYIHQLDTVKGTVHFRTSLDSGLKIMDSLRGYTSGMCVPQYMIDLPGGGGKIPLLPEYIKGKKKNKWLIKNYEGKLFEYPIN
ncbi:L-lysine 2,3-aminomutase [Candidatus Magnetomoraceae bacterium gMMP-1]